MGLFTKHTNLPENVVKILQEKGVIGVVPESKEITDKKGNKKTVFVLNARYVRKSDGQKAYDSEATKNLEEKVIFDEKTTHMPISYKGTDGKTKKGYVNMLGKIVGDPENDVRGKAFHQIVVGGMSYDDFLNSEKQRAAKKPTDMLFCSEDGLFREMCTEYWTMQIHAEYMHKAETHLMTYDEALNTVAKDSMALKNRLVKLFGLEHNLVKTYETDKRKDQLKKFNEELDLLKNGVANETAENLKFMGSNYVANDINAQLGQMSEKLQNMLKDFEEKAKQDNETYEEKKQVIAQTSELLEDLFAWLNGKPAPDLKQLKKYVNQFIKESSEKEDFQKKYGELLKNNKFKTILKHIYEKLEKNEVLEEVSQPEA